MMASEQMDHRLLSVDALLTRLGHCRFQDAPNVAIKAYAVGAAYSLKQAFSLGWSSGGFQAPIEEREADLLRVCSGDAPSAKWLAGYYYNSAVVRLIAADDCLHGRNNGSTKGSRLRADRNHLAHELLKVMRKDGLRATDQECILVLESVVAALEQRWLRRQPYRVGPPRIPRA